MTVREAAAFLRVSRSQLEKLGAAGKVPRAKIGSQVRFLRSELVGWLRSQHTR